MAARLSRALDVAPALRIAVSAVAGVVAGALLTWRSGAAAALDGWAVAGLLFVVWTLVVVLPMDGEATAEHARREVPGRTTTHVLVLLAAVASLAGVVVVLTDGGPRSDPVTLAAVLAAIVVSWAATQTLFALRYARLYYSPPVGGVDFHQDEGPRYSDFTYLAVTVGMSFAVSDTDLASSAFRRSAQLHALLAYLFGTVIVALVVNLVAGLAA